MELMTQVQILVEAVWILLCIYDICKGMNPCILSLAKVNHRADSTLALFKQPIKEKENSEFKPVTHLHLNFE